MIPCRRILPLVVVLGALVCTSVEAQIRVELRMSKRQYVAHEPVLATVTVTNHAGRDLLLHSEGAGRGTIPWIDFAMKDSRGTTLSPRTTVRFKSVSIPAGRSISKTVDLTGLYRVTEMGNYRGYAVVRMPGGGGIFNSNSAHFTVTKGRNLFTQRVGDPASRNVREYRVSVFNAKELYVHVVDVRTGRTLQAFRLGETLTFNKPKITVDRSNNLHVLYMTKRHDVYGHGRVSPEGKYLGTDYFKRASGTKPSLQTFPNGEVVVACGIPYDPKAERQHRAQIRRLSERPALTYR